MKRLLVAGLVLAAVAQPALAQKTAYTPAALNALAALPDWGGVWQPDWATIFRPVKPQLTSAAQKVVDEFVAKKAQGENLQGDVANCLPPGMPGIMRMPYPIEFIFTPGRVTILHETFSQVRRIYTDGRPLPEDPDPAFNGWSIGHWEGDVLVVETIGLNPHTSLLEGLHPTEQTRISERIYVGAPDRLTVDISITDPALFTAPYKLSHSYVRKRDWQMQEYVCEENNRDAADDKGRPSLNLQQ